MDRIRTDAAAHTHARQQLADQLDSKIGSRSFKCKCDEKYDLYEPGDFDEIAETVADAYAVVFERCVNKHGVAVRRIVMYGPEECDPSAPAIA